MLSSAACRMAVLFSLAISTIGWSQTAPERLADAIASAHGSDKLSDDRAIVADLVVEFQGKRMIDGTITFDRHAARSRIEQKDGTIAVFDGQRAWVKPNPDAMPRARFHLLTWPYFAMAPFKLRDPGTRLEDTGSLTLHGKSVPTAKLSFGAGVGDAPDDWYIVYSEPTTNRLKAMAYIVTYGGEDASKAEPHAIVYDKFVEVDGLLFSTDWTFTDWSRETGPTDAIRGRATLSNVRLVPMDDAMFAKPEGAVEDKLPGGE